MPSPQPDAVKPKVLVSYSRSDAAFAGQLALCACDIAWRQPGLAKPHEHLRGRNYIFFYEEPAVAGSGLATRLLKLIDALTSNAAWSCEYTRLADFAARVWIKCAWIGALHRYRKLEGEKSWTRI